MANRLTGGHWRRSWCRVFGHRFGPTYWRGVDRSTLYARCERCGRVEVVER